MNDSVLAAYLFVYLLTPAGDIAIRRVCWFMCLFVGRFVGKRGSGVGQLYYPCYLAVDEDSQFVFVADWFNNTVVLLSPTFVGDFSEELMLPH